MTRNDTQLEIRGVHKSYGSNPALQDVSMTLPEEGIYGLFGRNGAGKTTLLNIIASRIFPDRGDVICLGKDTKHNPEIVAETMCYMPEKDYFPGWFKVQALLDIARACFPDYDEGVAEKLCREFRLNTSQKYQQLSRGYQSIFRIVLGLSSNAGITIFDEPVLGLDAVARDQFYRELIEAYSRNPRMFIVSTHFIEESVDLFNEAIVIHDGHILRQAPVSEWLSNVYHVSGNADRVDAFMRGRTVIGTQSVDTLKTAVIEGDVHEAGAVPGLRFSPVTFQKLFIHLTSQSSREESSHE